MPVTSWRLRHRFAVNSSKSLLSLFFSSTKHSPLWHALMSPMRCFFVLLLHRDLTSSFLLFPIDRMKTEARGEETECTISSPKTKDLLLRFSGRISPDKATEANRSDLDEIELGLSLRGCFNSANCHKNRILRSCSIPAIPCDVPQMSLQWEEVQSKTRVKVEEGLEGEPVLKLRRWEIEDEVSSPAALRWRNPSTLMKNAAAASEGSVVSEGSNSFEGLESRSEQVSVTPISKPLNGTAISYGNVSNEALLRKNNDGRCSNGSGEISKSMTKDMPLVSTKGDGPNGQRIEGFLYKYGRGEEVRIICLCHASFFTPAEFVKHAGGRDVVHPLRHIVVNPTPAVFKPSFLHSTQKKS